MLLLAITRQKVWSKAESDSVGMEEAHDVIVADYKNYLMKNWVEELRSTYNVKINEAVLSSIK